MVVFDVGSTRSYVRVEVPHAQNWKRVSERDSAQSGRRGPFDSRDRELPSVSLRPWGGGTSRYARPVGRAPEDPSSRLGAGDRLPYSAIVAPPHGQGGPGGAIAQQRGEADVPGYGPGRGYGATAQVGREDGG